MSSGWVVGTISTTTWLPRSRSKAASLSSSACRWAAVSVPVWSMTRAVNGGTGTCANAGNVNQTSTRQTQAIQRRSITDAVAIDQKLRIGCKPIIAYLLLKSTLGGALMAASSATLKLGLGW